MLHTLITLAVLVPGVDLHEQPHLPDAVTAHAEVVLHLQTVMAEAEAATAEFLARQEAARVAEADERAAETAARASSARSAMWERLAECESGLWVDGGASFVEGSARWDYQYGQYRGGLQFDQPSWDWASDTGGHGMAGVDPATATRAQQVAHAETLLAIHPAGWGAWPVCSRLVGLR